jgi:PEP-CTERM motif
MKKSIFILAIAFLSVASNAKAQGTLVYDQQSSDDNTPGEVFAVIQASILIGQSFTPSLASVEFIRLAVFDINNSNGLGATVVVNLRTNSISGTILSSTLPVVMPDGFGVSGGAYTNFFFPSPVAVKPGTTYYFDITVQSGDAWGVRRLILGSDYVGGTEFLNSLPGSDDLWFREGIVVPEPSSVVLLLAGGSVLLGLRRSRRKARM